MKVLKYGGSSLQSAQLIKAVAQDVKEKLAYSGRLVVVASAMGKTTNGLIEKMKEQAPSHPKRELDQLLATGEIQSVSFLAAALREIGVRAKSLSGWQAGIETDANFSKAQIKKINKDLILSQFKDADVLVVAGFQGVSENGEVTTLGRGGSDTTAVALASVLGCACEIYTDVDGVCSVDPRIYKDAKKLGTVSYDQMIAMAHSGAKVLETRCVELAKKFGVNLYLGKSLEKHRGGTMVVSKKNLLENMPVQNVSVKDNLICVSVLLDEGQLGGVVESGIKNLNGFDPICVMQKNGKKFFKFYVDQGEEEKMKQLLKNFQFKIKNNLAKISLISSGVSNQKQILTEVLETLKKEKISYSNLVTSGFLTSFSVEKDEHLKTINKLATKFEL